MGEVVCSVLDRRVEWVVLRTGEQRRERFRGGLSASFLGGGVCAEDYVPFHIVLSSTCMHVWRVGSFGHSMSHIGWGERALHCVKRVFA